jgi:hypothetical protein
VIIWDSIIKLNTNPESSGLTKKILTSYFLFPFQALAIASSSVDCAFHPKTSLALSVLAYAEVISFSSSYYFIRIFSTHFFQKEAITSKTELPVPVPKLNVSTLVVFFLSISAAM